MGKTGKWLRNFLTGKKEKEKGPRNQNSANYSTENVTTTPLSTPQTNSKEKKRWSFRRSSATSASPRDLNPTDPVARNIMSEIENEHKRNVMAVAAATEAAVAAAQAAMAVIRLTAAANGKTEAIEEAAAIKIQSVFRSHLARKALCALKGLVKLQALVRGHLMRKQATATLRCMQALMTAQARARAQRIRMVEDGKVSNQRQSIHRKSIYDSQLSPQNHEHERGLLEENIKIVEVDLGNYKESLKNKNSHPQPEQKDKKIFTNQAFSTQENYQFSISPGPAALTEMSPRASSGHFEEYSFGTTQSSPQYYSAMSKSDPTKLPMFGFQQSEYAESLSFDYQVCPSYMANTESSRAKARSQSAPKTRPVEPFERQPSRRRVSIEGRNGVPRAVRMQRSSSHLGPAAQNYQYPWSVKLDRSTVSLKDSECGSTSTVLTNTNYCRSLVASDVSRWKSR